MRTRILELALALSLPVACVDVRPWRVQERPWTQASVEGAEEVRVSGEDGSTWVLEEVRVTSEGENAYIEGRPAERGGAGPEVRRIDLAEVARLETRRAETGRILTNAGIVTITVAVAVVVLVGAMAYALYG